MKPVSAPETLTFDDKFPIPEISIIIPVFNEEESIEQLIERIVVILVECNLTYEIICIDDGSQDNSPHILRGLSLRFKNFKAIIFRRNYGQTPAMAAGFKYAKGKIIITLDGDLQNDPIDIPRLINKLSQGYDLVNGWRKNRQDNTLTRLLPSKIANWIIGKVTGVNLHDYGCSLKAYRSELVADMNLYGELHRFLPALAYIEGAKITEMPVSHHPRRYGKSKYGLGRTFRVVMDLLTVFFIKRYLTRPMHVFGLFGFGSTILGLILGSYLIVIKLALGQSIGHRPLLILAVLLVLTGVQLLSFGLLAELVMRTYHESQKRPIYRVREIIGSHQD
ncbi:glycosyltransferase family 2 protein [Cyanobacterium sp. uoEpiScrs1]|uniref:glycosyltransferase family 2 protein n=1 Tax=Cyanobacterium sp. uoEpiScrs1 TaxID=2976343 RepID=UPI00226A78BD|nr:glycosyltransferase family 2 protein [Cyanobacterium sp. uoEpiScrs1]